MAKDINADRFHTRTLTNTSLTINAEDGVRGLAITKIGAGGVVSLTGGQQFRGTVSGLLAIAEDKSIEVSATKGSFLDGVVLTAGVGATAQIMLLI